MAHERLQKILAAAGVASRRKAEALIASGHVTVNGAIAGIGDSADASSDDIRVHGHPLKLPPSHTYLALNKPVGVVSSLRSTHGEPTIVDLLGEVPRVFPVGRLDKDTSGLLLLTDDGAWANLVTHPRYGVEKQYEVLVRGHPSSAALRQLESGITLPDGAVTAPAVVRRIGDDRGNSLLSITVVEGKKRQIRLMMAAVGHPVIELRRVRVGGIELGTLKRGAWRALRASEVEGLREIARGRPGGGGAPTPPAHQH